MAKYIHIGAIVHTGGQSLFQLKKVLFLPSIMGFNSLITSKHGEVYIRPCTRRCNANTFVICFFWKNEFLCFILNLILQAPPYHYQPAHTQVWMLERPKPWDGVVLTEQWNGKGPLLPGHVGLLLKDTSWYSLGQRKWLSNHMPFLVAGRAARNIGTRKPTSGEKLRLLTMW